MELVHPPIVASEMNLHWGILCSWSPELHSWSVYRLAELFVQLQIAFSCWHRPYCSSCHSTFCAAPSAGCQAVVSPSLSCNTIQDVLPFSCLAFLNIRALQSPLHCTSFMTSQRKPLLTSVCSASYFIGSQHKWLARHMLIVALPPPPCFAIFLIVTEDLVYPPRDRFILNHGPVVGIHP